ncbi:twin-arginine translocation signal domain-containing protein [Vibrio sp. SS-MA-C1-2]|uniref:twin-arginine translocation signal domain-containing protein n=1 Tax=Vibrio sp. SS-MA-C1-2 TaxID=2908646 RepID=UPI001F335BC1|nr:twin-arginine translocation signal domain-containing protein [Vibrio sp. SS-MA-C1-2]UJF18148.1 twin-arginine translocation signal domain-containing protein [Vibrio sp. SS-MA-C1-2]
MSEDNKSKVSRRKFLTGMGVATVAGGAALVSTSVSAKAVSGAEVTPAKKEVKTGYSETQHIRDYYNTL